MRLSKEQSQRLLRERGIWIIAACDRCGQLLGAVCWTRRGEPGEWCSEACRDGLDMISTKPATASRGSVRCKRIGARPAGRPKKHANNAEKCRDYRRRRNKDLMTRNTPTESHEKAQLATTKSGSFVVSPNLLTHTAEMSSVTEYAR